MAEAKNRLNPIIQPVKFKVKNMESLGELTAHGNRIAEAFLLAAEAIREFTAAQRESEECFEGPADSLDELLGSVGAPEGGERSFTEDQVRSLMEAAYASGSGSQRAFNWPDPDESSQRTRKKYTDYRDMIIGFLLGGDAEVDPRDKEWGNGWPM